MLRSFSRALSSSAGFTARGGKAVPVLRSASKRSIPAAAVSPRLPFCAARPSGLWISSPKSWLTTTRAAATEAVETEKKDPLTKYRKDYKPVPYEVLSVDLDFILNEDVTLVHSVLNMKPTAAGAPLVLDGRKDMKLVSIKVDGADIPSSSYVLTEKTLTISGLPGKDFKLQITTEIKPQENSLLEGLYKSGGNYTTQCEAEGFRGITYFLDRPDVMTTYTTRIEADKTKYPILLGNGNLTDSGDMDGGRHFAVWTDPWAKPCYLFALVAGDLAMRERMYKTMTGRDVALRVFTSENNIDKVDFALESLAKSMKWDEEVFGLEYDLDLFNIVAVDDFNAGAMENKSLNIFNSRLVLASPETATDGDYARIESVVGHEYFHNWTGNRVTCRDWFQLTLKEGLTVFRDQEFSADMNSRPVKRIEDVTMLRASQFAEDGGPMAHPIRPDSYIKMDNFYTVTVYEKGAEVVRMYNTLLGKEGFRKGMDLYFKRHDGQAVTCDDFRAAMADANGEDFSGLATWYSQAGTPHLEVATEYDAAAKTLTLKCKQNTPPSPGQDTKEPVLIPLAVGLIGPDGKDLPLKLQGNDNSLGTTTVLRMTQSEQSFTFTDVPVEPVPSVLRDFSAPVKLKVVGQTDEQLLFLFANDSDPFNRWESGQRMAKKLLLQLYHAAADTSKGGSVPERIQAAGGVSRQLINAFKSVLTDENIDGMFKAMAVTMPSSSELLDSIPEADPTLIHAVRTEVTKGIAASLRSELEAIVKANEDAPGTPFVFESTACSRRALKNKALALLSMLEQPEITADVLNRFHAASNMTDEIAALAALVEIGGSERESALAEFYNKYKSEPLVILKWLGLQSMSNAPGNLTLVKSLMEHEAFNIKNPNNCYTLFLGFARSAVNFHAADGSGYAFMADAILQVDKINHMVASRMMGAFTQWRKFDTSRQTMMKAQVDRILATEGLSENVFEIATKTIA